MILTPLVQRRYLLLTADRSILFEFTGCEHLADGFDTADEVRPAMTASFCSAGPAIAAREIAWAREMSASIGGLVGPRATAGMEPMNAGSAIALADHGVRVVDAQQPIEMARSIKSAEEVKCVKASLRGTETAVGKLSAAIRPGMTETEQWSVLFQSVIEQNGDYCETRLLNSGYRSNPWFREATHHVIEPRTALEQVDHNIGILQPGLSLRGYADRAGDIPADFHAHRYYLSAHGNGMTGEYPYLYHRSDFAPAGYDGEIVPGMTLCIESFIGREGGADGVKLEQKVLLITETGVEVLSEFPFEDALANPD